jgi:ABC-2 type transport system permease protein
VITKKALLVAAREYGENLRTKTFWLGVLLFPALLAIGVVVPRMLKGATDVRRYVVIDHSGWLHEAVLERAKYQRIIDVLEIFQRAARRGPSALEKMPKMLRPLAQALENVPRKQIEAQVRAATAGGLDLDGGEDLLKNLTAPSGEPVDLRETQREFLRWMSTLTPQEARKLGPGLDLGRYQEVKVPYGMADPEAWARAQLDSGEVRLFAYLVLGADPLDTKAQHKYVSNNRTDDDLREWYASLASEVIEAKRFEREHIDQSVARRIQEPLEFEEKQLDESGAEQEVSSTDVFRQWAPVAFVYLLWVSIFTIAQLLLTNMIEEKSNRIVEVLLSSVSPLELMSGKIVGIAMTGLTTILSWVVFFLIGAKLAPRFMDMPSDVDLTVLLSDPSYLVGFLIYFVLGFLLYASMMVAIGASCNSLKEAQNLMTPMMILLMLPLMAMVPVGKDPNGTLARVLSFIPPFTPFVMMNRAAGPPKTWEYVATTILLLFSVVLSFIAAAKVFRVGILMTGKPPKLSEIWRWVWS